MKAARHDRTLSPNPSPVKGEGSGQSRFASFTLSVLRSESRRWQDGDYNHPPSHDPIRHAQRPRQNH